MFLTSEDRAIRSLGASPPSGWRWMESQESEVGVSGRGLCDLWPQKLMLTSASAASRSWYSMHGLSSMVVTCRPSIRSTWGRQEDQEDQDPEQTGIKEQSLKDVSPPWAGSNTTTTTTTTVFRSLRTFSLQRSPAFLKWKFMRQEFPKKKPLNVQFCKNTLIVPLWFETDGPSSSCKIWAGIPNVFCRADSWFRMSNMDMCCSVMLFGFPIIHLFWHAFLFSQEIQISWDPKCVQQSSLLIQSDTVLILNVISCTVLFSSSVWQPSQSGRQICLAEFPNDRNNVFFPPILFPYEINKYFLMFTVNRIWDTKCVL